MTAESDSKRFRRVVVAADKMVASKLSSLTAIQYHRNIDDYYIRNRLKGSTRTLYNEFSFRLNPKDTGSQSAWTTAVRITAQQEFGKRLVSADAVINHAWLRVKIVLDDAVEKPRVKARAASINNPIQREETLSSDDKFDFWTEVLEDPPVRKKCRWSPMSYMYAANRKLKHDVVAYKKAQHAGRPVIVEMIIPAGTRVNATEGKCRASKATVVSITDIKNAAITYTQAGSCWAPLFRYGVGETVRPHNGWNRSGNECESGIHFFVSINEALDYGA